MTSACCAGPAAPPTSPVPGALQAIAACESGGNPRAVGGGGAFRGKYQFDYGDLGAASAAAATRRRRPRPSRIAARRMLYARAGASPWPVCGR